MQSPLLLLILIFTACLSLGSVLQPWYQQFSQSEKQTSGVLETMIGDSRRLFASHFFAKADAYFHSGYYPSIFDDRKTEEESHMAGGEEEAGETGHEEHHEAEAEHSEHGKESEGGFLGPPKDWIDRFSRNFFPSTHSHLDKNGDEREILPWLRLSAELDPQRIDTYTISAYWLRSRLKKVKEAEQFLREGLRANPDSYEIYFELGRIYDEDRHDARMARNLWEIALRKWQAQDAAGSKPTDLVYLEITGRLARLEESQGDLKQAIHYLKLLKEKSPSPEQIQKQIEELEQKVAK